MKNTIFKLAVIALLAGIIGAPANVSADMSKLVSMLMKNLNVTQDQAAGGAGTLFATAKEKLSPADFTKVSDALPGIDDLISAASKIGGTSGSDAASMVGSVTGAQGTSAAQSLGALSGLGDSFSKLGLSPDMIGKFSDTILQYANANGGGDIMNLLKGALL